MSEPTVPPANDIRSGLRPPQFGLRALLLGTALICLMLALMKWMSGAVILVVVVLLLSVLAHVAGNALGTQLRDTGSRRLPDDAAPDSGLSGAARPLAEHDFAPRTRLSHRQALGWVCYAFPVATSLASAVGGGLWLRHGLGAKATWGNLAFGSGAFAVIGAILGFLLGTFVKVLVTANLEAWQNGEQSS